MKYRSIAVLLTATLTGGICLAQTAPVEDFKKTPTTQQEKQYPQVNSERRVRVSIPAPEAQRVQLDIGGVKYDLKKDDKGVWTGESAPQDEGFHYYQLNVDGASVPDPGSLYYYGASRWGSGIEIPAKDQDFYALKNVPHGAGEDETGWVKQGHLDIIMDNLIAQKQAVPMIVVTTNEYVIRDIGAGYNTESTNHFMAEFAWAQLEPTEGNYDFCWLDRAVDLAAKNNLKVMLCTPSATPPVWLTKKYPEVLVVKPDGQTAMHVLAVVGGFVDVVVVGEIDSQ